MADTSGSQAQNQTPKNDNDVDMDAAVQKQTDPTCESENNQEMADTPSKPAKGGIPPRKWPDKPSESRQSESRQRSSSRHGLKRSQYEKDESDVKYLRNLRSSSDFEIDPAKGNKNYHNEKFWRNRCLRCGQRETVPKHHWKVCPFDCFWCNNDSHWHQRCTKNAGIQKLYGVPDEELMPPPSNPRSKGYKGFDKKTKRTMVKIFPDLEAPEGSDDEESVSQNWSQRNRSSSKFSKGRDQTQRGRSRFPGKKESKKASTPVTPVTPLAAPASPFQITAEQFTALQNQLEKVQKELKDQRLYNTNAEKMYNDVIEKNTALEEELAATKANYGAQQKYGAIFDAEFEDNNNNGAPSG